MRPSSDADSGSGFGGARPGGVRRQADGLRLVARELPLQQLGLALQAAGRGESRRVRICGAAGAGKTALLSSLRELVWGQGGECGIGREEPIASPRPLGALGAALDDLAAGLVAQGGQRLAEVRTAVARAVGGHADQLAPIGPWVRCLLPKAEQRVAGDGGDEAHRLADAAEQFVYAVAHTVGVLAVCCDDLHRADEQTLEVLRKMGGRPNCPFLLVEVFREESVTGSLTLVDRCYDLTVQVDNLSLPAIGELLAAVCGDFAGEHAALAELLWQRTAGNAFQTLTYVDLLVGDGIVERVGAAPGHWRVDLPRAAALAATADGASLAARRLTALDAVDRKVLATAARIGATFSAPLLAEVLALPAEQVRGGLNRAAALGAVAWVPEAGAGSQDNWQFLHDRLHEAAVDLLDRPTGEAVHAHIGTVLMGRLAPDAPPLAVMAAAHQLNLGRPAGTASQDGAALGEANLRAARAAYGVGAFAAALDFCDAGLRLVGSAEPALQRDLVVEAVAAARAAARGRVGELVHRLQTLAPTALQMATALAVRADTVLSDYDTAGALVDIRKGLALLGYQLPLVVSKGRVLVVLLRAQLALRSYSTERLQALPAVRDPHQAAILGLLLRGSTAAYLSDGQLFGFLCCEMVRLGLRAGNCPATGYGLLVFGLLQAAALGRLEHGRRLGTVALAMVDRYPRHGVFALSRAVWHVTLDHLCAPLRSTVQPLRQAARAGLAEGDALQAGVCACFYIDHLLFSGASLGHVASEARLALADMHARGQFVSHQTLAPFAALARLLVGEPDPYGLLEDRALVSNDAAVPIARFVRFSIHFCRCALAVLRSADREALTHADLAMPDLEAVAGTIHVPLYHYFVGVAEGRLLAAGEPMSLRRLRRCRKVLAAHAALCPADYQGRVALLDGLLAFGAGQHGIALGHLDRSQQLLTAADLPHEAAIALLTQAMLLERTGAVDLARAPRQAAVRLLRRWGSAHLADDAAQLLPAEVQAETAAEQMAQTAMQGTGALAAVRTPDGLRSAFLRLAMVQLDAQRVLWLEAGQGELRVRAELTSGGEPQLVDAGLGEFAALCRPAAAHAARTGQIVAQADVRASPTLGSDPWVVQAGLRALLALPMPLGGQVVAVLVAEHRDREGHYAPAAVSGLRVTGVAMAALLRSAELSADRERHAQALEAANRSLDEQRQTLETTVQERTAALDQAVRLQAAVLGALWEGVCGLDAAGTVTFCNAAAQQMLGKNAVGLPFHRQFHRVPADANLGACPLCDASQPLQDYPTTLYTAAGSELQVECSLQTQATEGQVGVRVLSIRDVTRRRQLEQELRHTQKMEAIGRFVGGVAHEFNNLLTPISSHVALAQTALDPAHSLQQPLADVATATERAAGLVRQLLSLGRRADVVRQPVDLGVLVEAALRLLRPTLDRRIVIDHRVPVAAIWAEVHADQIHQVLLNLCLNARDAMLSQREGDKVLRIEVTVRLVDIEPFGRADHVSRQRAQWVELAVRDNGPGIAPELHSRIFEPFFTTKPEGQGAGLGLGVVLGIIEQHGGWVSVASTPGEGTTVQCMLVPCVAPTTTAAPPVVRVSSTEGAGKRVLIIDDEPVVRRVGRAVLEKAGFSVAEAHSGAVGLEEVARNPGFDLVLLDVLMPGLDGWQTLERLRSRHPELPVVMWTGYDDRMDAQRSKVQAVTRLIKPFANADLLAAVRTALRQAHKAGSS